MKNSNNKIINESKILKLNPEIHSPINESAGYTVNPIIFQSILTLDLIFLPK